MRLIQLLEQKNHYLEKFLTLNELQIRLLSDTNADTLDEFYEQREKILEIIQYIDSQISESYQNLSTTESGQAQAQVQKLLFVKDEYVHRILDQDIQILGMIDQIKSAIMSELSDIRSSRKALKGYKSGPSNRKLNEEA